MAERRISYAADVENGQNATTSRIETDINNDNAQTLDEYTALNRYISTARDRRRGSTSSAGGADADASGKKPWWKFGGKSSSGVDDTFVAPDDWVDTDIRAGLRSSDIEPRRRKTGWNELVTEKTNLFVQFIGYFRGPILYGKFGQQTRFFFFFRVEKENFDRELTMVSLCSHGIGCPLGCWSS